MQMNSSSLRMFSCSVLQNSRLIWNSLKNLYSSYFKHLKWNFYKMLCLSTIHNQWRQKTFANEYMTKLNQRQENPIPVVFCMFIFALETAVVQGYWKSFPVPFSCSLNSQSVVPVPAAVLVWLFLWLHSKTDQWNEIHTFSKTRNVFLFKLDYFTDLLRSTAQQTAESAQPEDEA